MLRALGLGDLLTAVPALRGLRAAFPDAEITLAAPAWLEDAVSRIEAVDRLLPTAELAPIDFAGPDLAVNLHGRGPQSVERLLATEPRRLITYAEHGWWDERVTAIEWPAERHEVLRWCELLQRHGVPCDADDFRLAPVGERTGPVVIHPGASTGARRWPVERYAAVARAVGGEVVVTAGPGEGELARQVVAGAREDERAGDAADGGAAAGGVADGGSGGGDADGAAAGRLGGGDAGRRDQDQAGGVRDLEVSWDESAAGSGLGGHADEARDAGQDPAAADLVLDVPPPSPSVFSGTLAELLDLVATARLVICGDTGVAHVATAYRTPSVVLFGPVSPHLWGPRRGPHRALWHGRAGDTFADVPDPGLLRITVEEVLEAVGGVLCGSESSVRATSG